MHVPSVVKTNEISITSPTTITPRSHFQTLIELQAWAHQYCKNETKPYTVQGMKVYVMDMTMNRLLFQFFLLSILF